jgi:hypothetical protein
VEKFRNYNDDGYLRWVADHHALGFYRAVGFVDCGVEETEFGGAPRMVLAISLLRRHHQVSVPQHRQLDGSPGRLRCSL